MRTDSPLRRWLLVSALVVAASLALVVAFFLGRGNSGPDVKAARQQQSTMQAELQKLQEENRQLRLKVAAQETERIGQIRERTELGRSIGDLQAQLEQATSDLAFYRTVAGEKLSNDPMKIQQLRITRGRERGEFMLRLVLGRPVGHEDSINGRIRITFEGVMGATPTNMDLAAVSEVDEGELLFNYRYSQTIEVPLRFPASFTPARTAVSITPSRKGVNPIRTSFMWTVEN